MDPNRASSLFGMNHGKTASARGTGARQTALFLGRTRGRLSLKKLGQLAGGIHHNAVGIAIRRFTQRLQNDRTLLESKRLANCTLTASADFDV
jgi:chromosomal replication initiation ATPase DnaA